MMESSNEMHQNNNEWDKVIWDKPHSFSYQLAKISGKGVVFKNKVVFLVVNFWIRNFRFLIIHYSKCDFIRPKRN